MSLAQNKIILIGNYIPDKQESMQLFAGMLLESCLAMNIPVEILFPTVFFGAFSKVTNKGVGKWLSYMDKYLVFPFVLISKRLALFIKNQQVQFHICDHSNSPYLFWLPVRQTVITCHDVLAIRGALGFKDAYCASSFTGKILQQWILNNLLKARRIAFVSSLTKSHFLELKIIKKCKDKDENYFYPVIYNGFNKSFRILSEAESGRVFKKYKLEIISPYLFHVGSDLPRKNRKLLVDLLYEMKDTWNGLLCYAGQDLNDELKSLINEYGLNERVVCIIKPTHELIEALYNRSEAFVFPSFSEGFGWPLIEAQACGVPVITSSLEPMIEVCGGGAIHADPGSIKEFSDAVTSLKNTETRTALIRKGLKNIERFNTNYIMSKYLTLYKTNNEYCT